VLRASAIDDERVQSGLARILLYHTNRLIVRILLQQQSDPHDLPGIREHGQKILNDGKIRFRNPL